MPPRALLASLLLSLSLVACGGAEPDTSDHDSTGTGEPTAGSESPAVLTFGDVAFFADGQGGPVLFADGHVEMEGETIGTFHPDGRLVSTQGELLAVLHPNGILESDALGGEAGTIAEDGTLTHGEIVLRFDDAGNVIGGPEGMPALRAEGVVPSSRRASMFIIALFVLSAH
jgi:prepilin-type processing-associated H-X9-DG protein